MNKLLDAALAYAKRGMPVFPGEARDGTKKPRIKGWRDAATTDEQQIREWWGRWPDALIGTPTGEQSGVFVLDVDVKNGHDGNAALWALTEEHNALPDTVESLTPSGGRQLFFQWPGTPVKNSVSELGDGLDVRGDGGLVFVPPSVVNGARYEWEASSPDAFATAPEWLVELVRKPPERERQERGPVNEEDVRRASAALWAIRYDGSSRDRWLEIGMGFKAAGGELETFVGWCRVQPGYVDDDRLRTEWESWSPDGGIGPGTLFKHAYDAGWSEPGPDLKFGDGEGGEGGEDAEDENEPPIGGLTTEDALALELARRYPDTRFVAEWSQWMLWSGQRWERDRVLRQFDRARTLCRAAARAVNEGTAAARLKKAATVSAVVSMARSDRRWSAVIEQWDTEPLLLNTPAGIVHLETGAVGAHEPGRYMTKLTRGTLRGGDWRRVAPRFAAFLEEITSGDGELAAYLQRLFGYGCTGLVREHVLPFVYGPGGNGKGTLVESVAWALGDYAQAMPEGFLAEQRGERHATELANLHGARLAYASETEAGSRWNEARLKALTGADTITARRMRQDFFEFEPTHTLVVVGNNKPAIRSVDDAIKRRIQVVPLTHRPKRPDHRLPAALRAEADGILMWAVEGARAWLRDGLCPSEAVEAASESYFSSQDMIGEWIEERCHTGPRWESAVTPLWASYQAWCDEKRARPGFGRTGFGDELEKKGFPRLKGGGGVRRHEGIALRD